MRWKQVIIIMLISLLLGWLNQYFKVFTINYNVKYMIDACVIFYGIMFILLMFDYSFKGGNK